MADMSIVSIVNGIINQLIPGGVPPCILMAQATSSQLLDSTTPSQHAASEFFKCREKDGDLSGSFVLFQAVFCRSSQEPSRSHAFCGLAVGPSRALAES